MSLARRRHQQEEHVSHERWLVSYADFLTLLLAFFVVMYSISQVSESKYRVLSETLNHAFSKPGGAWTGKTEDGESPGEPVALPVLGEEPPSRRPASQAPTEQGVPADLTAMVEQLQTDFADLASQELLTVSGNEHWLQIELKSSLLFDSGSADPRTEARPLLRQLAAMLVPGNKPIRVEGYTDNEPINSPRYPSNWELSAARAAAIVRVLVGEGVAPWRLSAMGYGEHNPVAENISPEGRARNRRVVLMIGQESRPKLNKVDLSGARAGSVSNPAALPSGGAVVTESRRAPSVSQAPSPESPPSGAAAASSPSAGAAPSGVRQVPVEGGGMLFTSEKPTQPVATQ